MSRLITYSEILSHYTCKYKRHLQYDLGIKPIAKNNNFYIGSAFHRMLELRTGGISTEDNFDVILKEFPGVDIELLQAMFYGYLDFVNKEESDTFVIVESEAEFRVELPIKGPEAPYYFAGKCDGIVRVKSNNSMLILEYKTASSTGESMEDFYYNFDMQTPFYMYGIQRSRGIKIDGAIVEIIRKAKKTKLDRVTRLFIQPELSTENIHDHIVEVSKEILFGNTKTKERRYMNCVSCQYKSLCVNWSDVDYKENYTVVEKIHSELSFEENKAW